MVRCDVLIVGGGPAGSSCAWRLRQAGLDVAVLDKKSFPRDKVCAGWVTPAVIEELQLDRDDYGKGRVFQPITGFRVGQIGGPELELAYDEPVSYGILRREFDHYLLKRCGATLHLGEAVKKLERTDEMWRVNDMIEAPMLVGAGGHFCPVAQHLGAQIGGELVVAAQEIEFPLTAEQNARCNVREQVPELYFCRDLLGYGWCFRKGDYLNIGLGREDKADLSEHVRAFLAFLKERGRIPADTPDRLHGHAYILYGHARRKLIDDGVLLIGDAAGLAYPQSGEGIRAAVESALLAADVIAGAKGFTRAALEPYATRLTERFGQPAEADGWGRFIPDGLKQAIAARLLSMGWFARNVVVDRWFLHRQQPALAVAGGTRV